MRRNRSQVWLRDLVAENRLAVEDLIWPVFVIAGDDERQPVLSMPGVERVSVDQLATDVAIAAELGILAVTLFPYTEPNIKTPDAREAYNPDNLVCQAVRTVKKIHPGIGVICDVALDPYNTDGHDGLVRDGRILNDETIEVLCRQALVQAAAGCDVIAPSDMMDGRIGKIRKALDKKNFQLVQILSYAVKYASNFYGPFRDAVGSKINLKGNKKNYQMDFFNQKEALREVALDIKEGADFVMVKPGMPYLDIIKLVSDTFKIPVFAYQVSGEYSLIKNGIKKKIISENAIEESLMSFKRAGASAIVTYFADYIAQRLR